jgi:putative transposase
LESGFPVDILCEALFLSRAGYYRYRQGKTFKEDKEQAEAVKNVFSEHKRRYGSRRIAAELKAQGKAVGRWRVRKSMQQQALKAIQPKSFAPKTTDSTHGKRSSPNLLLDEKGNRLFTALAPNQIWYSDITYLPIQGGGFNYLCLWTDLFSRKIVGWQVEENMEESLVIKALENGLQTRKPEKGLILHSDRGGQYVSRTLRLLIKKWQCRQSMSRADNCYDNAIGESLFSRLKAELIQNGTFLNLEDARTEIFEYIEIYYNRVRRHSALDYQSPEQFEEKYKINIVSLASILSH